MKVLSQAFASTALLATLAAANASTFTPLGQGALPSGNYVEDFQFTLFQGETVPWHYHPGQIYGVVVSGTLTEEQGCGQPARAFTAGSAFAEKRGAVHRVFNFGTDPVVIVFTFIVPAAYKDYNGITTFVDGPRCQRRDDD